MSTTAEGELRRRRHATILRCGQASHGSGHGRRRQQSGATVVRIGMGLAELEPAASSLSAIEGSALCGPAFPQVAGDPGEPEPAAGGAPAPGRALGTLFLPGWYDESLATCGGRNGRRRPSLLAVTVRGPRARAPLGAALGLPSPERREAGRRCCPAPFFLFGVQLALPLASTAASPICSVALAAAWPTC